MAMSFPAVVGEPEPVGIVGVSADEELPAVVSVVMMRAQARKVPHVGGSPVAPVGHVMHLEVGASATSGVAAAAVSVLDKSGSGLARSAELCPH